MIRPVSLWHQAKTMIMYLNIKACMTTCMSLSLSLSLSLSQLVYLIRRPGLFRYIKSLIVECSAGHVSRCLDQNPRRPIWHLELMHHLNIMLWKTLKLKTNVFMYPCDMRNNTSNCSFCQFWGILSWHKPIFLAVILFFNSPCLIRNCLLKLLDPILSRTLWTRWKEWMCTISYTTKWWVLLNLVNSIKIVDHALM